MKTIEDLLGTHPFTQGLDDEILRLIAGCATNVVFESGSYLFREGGNADRFFLLRHGTVALELFVPGEGARTFLTVKSGEMLGVTGWSPRTGGPTTRGRWSSRERSPSTPPACAKSARRTTTSATS